MLCFDSADHEERRKMRSLEEPKRNGASQIKLARLGPRTVSGVAADEP